MGETKNPERTSGFLPVTPSSISPSMGAHYRIKDFRDLGKKKKKQSEPFPWSVAVGKVEVAQLISRTLPPGEMEDPEAVMGPRKGRKLRRGGKKSAMPSRGLRKGMVKTFARLVRLLKKQPQEKPSSGLYLKGRIY